MSVKEDVHMAKELLRTEGLRQEDVGSEGERFLPVGILPLRSQHDHRGFGSPGEGTDLSEDFQPRVSGHHDIENNQIVGGFAAHRLHRSRSILGHIHPQAGGLDDRDENPADMRLVLGDEETMGPG